MFSNPPYFFVTILTLSFKMSPRTLKNVDYFESYLTFKKTFKFLLFFATTSSKFNETTSFWTHFIPATYIIQRIY